MTQVNKATTESSTTDILTLEHMNPIEYEPVDETEIEALEEWYFEQYPEEARPPKISNSRTQHDRRREMFTIIPNAVLFDNRLSPLDKTVYSILRSHINCKKNVWSCFPKTDTIGTLVGCSRQTVSKSVERLESLGYLVIKRKRGSQGKWNNNTYVIVKVGSDHTEDYAKPKARKLTVAGQSNDQPK